jgi:hypothetical protein
MRERERNKERKDGMNEYLRNKKQVKRKLKNRIKSNQTGLHRFSPRQIPLLYVLFDPNKL